MINNKKNRDRFEVLLIVFAITFGVMILKLSYMTIIKGDEYYAKAQNMVYKKIPTEAPRGEIRDRYGRLLAGNRPSFTLQISKNEIPEEDINEISSKLIEILENNGEEYIDEFPIIIENGKYTFIFDKKIKQWKEKNNVPLSYNAKDSFYFIVEQLQNSGEISVDKNMDKVQLQKALNEKGVYPPIFVSTWEFSEEKNKKDWLYRYKIRDDEEIAEYAHNPKKTFEAIRQYYEIDEDISDEDARKIMVIRDLLKSQGYLQYQPVKVARDLKQETVSIIEELGSDLPGVSIAVEPIRYYPNGSLASHILGQLGKISQEDEINTYVNEKGYAPSDIIGKTGIEKSYEEQLHGEKGYNKVVVDSSGRLVDKIESQSPSSGDTVYLTIDKDLQQVAEDSLERAIKTLQVGGTYESEWGDVRLTDGKKTFSNATSGAVVALDVKTGDVLALASYPDYDPNLFAAGISTEDMEKLMPENPNDPLAPKPLYNVATFTAVQPGSTFKMITGLAAIDKGLDPYYTIYDKGSIMLGNKSFGCWKWNASHGSHGNVNLMTALQNSCNYYFYCVAAGYDYAKNKPLIVDMSVDDVLYYAKLFGLDEKTGIEIEEVAGKVPNPDLKLKNTKRSLNYALHSKLKNCFIDIDPEEDKDEYDRRIDEIVSWSEENPSRGTIMKRLTDLKIKEDKVAEVTDFIKYSYFNQAEWTTADTFNIAIGQGENAYTTLQMANYISSLANGGYKNKVTVVDKVESSDDMEIEKTKREREKIPLKDDKNLEYVLEGMRDVADDGTAKSMFRRFPIPIGAKTGTAEKSGRIPTKDEYGYLMSHMGSYNVDSNEAVALANKYEKNSKEKQKPEYYLKKAIQTLNPSLSDDDINRFKPTYDNFGWFVSFAPAKEPEIAVVTMIFQAGHGSYGGVVARDVIAQYFGIHKTAEDADIKENLNLKEELQR